MPATPPKEGTISDTSPSRRNGPAIAGFILSLVALLPPIWLSYSFATNYDEWFDEGLALYGANALWTVLFVIFIFVPGELLLLAPAYVLSATGISRARSSEQPRGSLGIAGLTISIVATILLAAIVVVALTADSNG